MQRRRKESKAIRATTALADDPFGLDDRYNPVPGKRPGLLAMILGLFSKKRRSRPRNRLTAGEADRSNDEEDRPDALQDDAVRAILTLPRGAARLDAFERGLSGLLPGSPSYSAVAIAFWRELTTLAERASVDLSLLKARTEACADALIAADEMERAGNLLAKIGQKRRAAELFVAAGAIDELEAAHAALSLEEGGERLEARLHYERFEGLFVVGLRRDALDALEAANQAWPENPGYREIGESFRRRLRHNRVRLVVGAQQVTVERFPLSIGRSEDASLRVASPLVSREHVEINLDGGRAFLRDLQARNDVTLGGEPLGAPRPLQGDGEFELSGVTLRFATTPHTLCVWALAQPDARCVALLVDEADIPIGTDARLRIGFDDEGHAVIVPTQGVQLLDSRLEGPCLLLEGDRLTVGGLRVKVTG